jgi:NAD(P)-dependent dehydrogenase (short-subunit alcohol dehydrogenase family)
MTTPKRSGVVVITGAASGIGRAVALAQAAEGRRLALLDIDEHGVHAVADEARTLGAPSADAWRCDVSVESDVARVFAELATVGRVNAVFSNAGIERNEQAHRMSPTTWAQVLDTNLTGSFLVCRAAIATMLDGGDGGSIVCTSSPAAFQGFVAGGNAAYAASKGGIGAFVRSLAVDYAPHGIRVNAVVPGAIDTPILVAESDDATASLARMKEEAQTQIPLGRLGHPDEVAKAVSWLLGPDSSYVTGTHLVCDGGLLARSSNTF